MSILVRSFRITYVILILLLSLIFTVSKAIGYDLEPKEKILFILDCWKYNFGWKTLGGGYIRHFLVFTENKIIDIETDQISYTPAYSYSYFDLSKYSDKSLYESLFFATLETIITFGLEKILGGSPQEKLEKELNQIILLLEKDPTLENFLKLIERISIKIKNKDVFLYRYLKSTKIKTKNDEINFSFLYKNKKYKYFIKNRKKEVIKEISKIVDNIINEKIKDINYIEDNYLKVYTEKKPTSENFTKNSIFVEFGGQSFGFSLNYDYRIFPILSLRVGAGYLYTYLLSINLITFPKSSNHIEISSGVTFLPFGAAYLTFNFGYRFQPYEKDSFMMILKVSVLKSNEETKWYINGGLSLGYCW
ncbi:MAG: hypothetical protein NZ928_00125 [Endomicrobia bacterium]|nr:hypothetical protein [Endomicrobiia bacterium]MCX7911214.1 hypothetical protein [Endomicrobiia bacterium]MDW8055925.1 hypothetical protein [Elusimicrobiota bacterium]